MSGFQRTDDAAHEKNRGLAHTRHDAVEEFFQLFVLPAEHGKVLEDIDEVDLFKGTLGLSQALEEKSHHTWIGGHGPVWVAQTFFLVVHKVGIQDRDQGVLLKVRLNKNTPFLRAPACLENPFPQECLDEWWERGKDVSPGGLGRKRVGLGVCEIGGDQIHISRGGASIARRTHKDIKGLLGRQGTFRRGSGILGCPVHGCRTGGERYVGHGGEKFHV